MKTENLDVHVLFRFSKKTGKIESNKQTFYMILNYNSRYATNIDITKITNKCSCCGSADAIA